MNAVYPQSASLTSVEDVSFPDLASTIFVPHRYRPGGLRTWSGHLPFARDLAASLRPELFVELGTHYGESYFGFCQSVAEAQIPCICYAVDTWRGDSHAGEYGGEVYDDVECYNREHYRDFSYLLRTSFDDAVSKFSDGTIDLLHIDGLHIYAAVSHDWETWFPKVAPGGIILLHDIAVRHVDFGVWKLWEQVSEEFESFEFHHGYGLGVVRKRGPDRDYGGILRHLFQSVNAPFIRRHYVSCAERLDLIADLAQARERFQEPEFRIYYPHNGGFSESASTAAALQTGSWQKVAVELAAGLDGSMLRLDPVDRPAVVDIGSVALFHAFDRRELCRFELRDRSATVEGTAVGVPAGSYLRLFAYGSDPSVLLPVPTVVPQQEPLILECWIRLHTDFSLIADRIASRYGALDAMAPTLDGQFEERHMAAQIAVDAGVLIDPQRDILAEDPQPGVSENYGAFLEVPLNEAAVGRNDWNPADEPSDTWACSTEDPWTAFEIPDVSGVRWFAVRMSCTADVHSPQAQLFWLTADSTQFEELYSIRFSVVPDGKAHTYLVDLRTGEESANRWSKAERLIRFDPLNAPGRFRILRAGFVLEGPANFELLRSPNES